MFTHNLREYCKGLDLFLDLHKKRSDIFFPFPTNKFQTHLSFGKVETLGQLLAFLSHNVLVLLECMFQLKKLIGREGRPDPLGFAEGKQELWEVWTWGRNGSGGN